MQTTPPDDVRRDRTRAASARSGLMWSSDEDAALRVEFRRGTSLDEMAWLHGRPVHAIRTRLLALNEPLVLVAH